MKDKEIRKITGVAVLMAIEIILQVLGNLITFPGGISVNISLIPIAIGAIVYGPLAGALLGFVNGFVVLLSPSTQAVFMPYAPFGTIITCLFKCTIAGFLSGLVYELIGKKNKDVGAIIAALIVPIINTGLFALCAFSLMINAIKNMNSANVEMMRFVFLVMIGWNFILEFTITSVLTPAIEKLRKIMTRSNKHAL